MKKKLDSAPELKLSKAEKGYNEEFERDQLERVEKRKTLDEMKKEIQGMLSDFEKVFQGPRMRYYDERHQIEESGILPESITDHQGIKDDVAKKIKNYYGPENSLVTMGEQLERVKNLPSEKRKNPKIQRYEELLKDNSFGRIRVLMMGVWDELKKMEQSGYELKK